MTPTQQAVIDAAIALERHGHIEAYWHEDDSVGYCPFCQESFDHKDDCELDTLIQAVTAMYEEPTHAD